MHTGHTNGCIYSCKQCRVADLEADLAPVCALGLPAPVSAPFSAFAAAFWAARHSWQCQSPAQNTHPHPQQWLLSSCLLDTWFWSAPDTGMALWEPPLGLCSGSSCCCGKASCVWHAQSGLRTSRDAAQAGLGALQVVRPVAAVAQQQHVALVRLVAHAAPAVDGGAQVDTLTPGYQAWLSSRHGMLRAQPGIHVAARWV